MQCQPGDLLEFTSIEADFHDLATAPSQDTEAALKTKTFRSFNEKELATPHSGKMNTRTKSDSERLGEVSPRAKANVKRAHRGCWIELTVLSSLPNSATGLPTIHMAGEDHLKSNSCALNHMSCRQRLHTDISGKLLLDNDGMPGGMLAIAVDPSES